MSVRRHSGVQRLIERTLRGGPWADQPWDERSRRVGEVTLQCLRSRLPSESVASALQAAESSVQTEVPSATPVLIETANRVGLVWAVRALVHAAWAAPEQEVRTETLLLAGELAQSLSRLHSADDAAGQAPFEVLVEATREAFTIARDDTDPRSAEGPFLAAWLHQLKHIASLLVVGGHSVDELLRGAIQRTDRVIRREAQKGWGESHETQVGWSQRGLVEAAWALASRVFVHQNKGAHGREAGLWLARTACVLLARLDKMEGWVPLLAQSVQGPVVPATPPAAARTNYSVNTAPVAVSPTTAKPKTERTIMNEKITPVLKTLEADAGEAAWRLAGSQFVKLAKEPIVALLSRHLAPDDVSMRARIATFLDTEIGTSVLSALLSVGLQALPVSQGEVTAKLARELRVKAMAGAGDVIADVLMGPLRQVAVLYLQGMPGSTQSPSEPAALPLHAAVETLKTQAETMRDAVVPSGESLAG